jgi:hypothetical protein
MIQEILNELKKTRIHQDIFCLVQKDNELSFFVKWYGDYYISITTNNEGTIAELKIQKYSYESKEKTRELIINPLYVELKRFYDDGVYKTTIKTTTHPLQELLNNKDKLIEFINNIKNIDYRKFEELVGDC